jgi:hypothetical protein|tara:strand:- start:64 stop:372 length:309 start_codon:yes stop_codon:yes gene_type:complete
MSEYSNTELYSCCENNEAPNWGDFTLLTLEGCVEEVSNPDAAPKDQVKDILGGQVREDAEFFTVYGWNNGSRAITDVDDLEQAIRIIQHLSETSGLEHAVLC